MSARCSDCVHFQLVPNYEEGDNSRKVGMNCTKGRWTMPNLWWENTATVRHNLRIAKTCSIFKDIRLDETGAVLPEERQDG